MALDPLTLLVALAIWAIVGLGIFIFGGWRNPINLTRAFVYYGPIVWLFLVALVAYFIVVDFQDNHPGD